VFGRLSGVKRARSPNAGQLRAGVGQSEQELTDTVVIRSITALGGWGGGRGRLSSVMVRYARTGVSSVVRPGFGRWHITVITHIAVPIAIGGAHTDLWQHIMIGLASRVD
jgi:hypothetical protein